MSVLARTAAALGWALGVVTALAGLLGRLVPGRAPGAAGEGRDATAGAPAAPPAPRPRAPIAPGVVGALAGALVAAAVFLPWYATNLGPPFSTGSASGWSATGIAQVVFALGLVGVATGVVLALEARGLLQVQVEIAIALAWVLLAAAALALALVAYRVLVLPEPAALLSRDWGLYLAGVGALAGLVAGIGQVSARA